MLLSENHRLVKRNIKRGYLEKERRRELEGEEDV